MNDVSATDTAIWISIPRPISYVWLVTQWLLLQGSEDKPTIASRNAHKAFVMHPAVTALESSCQCFICRIPSHSTIHMPQIATS